MISFATILDLMRVRQWYKNLLIFLPLVFVGMLGDTTKLGLVCLGFLSLSLLSSANYILNDILDAEKDRHHKEKKARPIASGQVSVHKAILMMLGLLIVSVAIGSQFAPFFLVSLAALFALTTAYSLGLKNEPFLDILLISVNFVIRAISGTFIINVSISPWLILCPFFLSLFLAVGKRHSDLTLLGAKATSHKPVLKYYTHQVTSALLIVTATGLIICYSLYAFLSNKGRLIFTLPVAIYVILRYLHHIYTSSEISRNPERAYKDPRLMAGALVWVALTVLILYVF